MIEFFKIYLIVQFLSILLLPLARMVFKSLPDIGYSFYKVFSLLISSYIFWILVTFGFIQNNSKGVFLILVLLIIFSTFLFIKDKKVILKEMLSMSKKIIFLEILFFVIFTTATIFRAFLPEISGTEKIFEFMFMNSIDKSITFPPHDAWFAGSPISYYYFGYIILNFLVKITGVPTSYMFNIGISLTLALTTVAIFGVAYNLICLFMQAKLFISEKRKIIFSLFIVSLVLVIGNFESLFEILAINKLGNHNFYSLLNIEGLSGFKESRYWFPDEHWFWWRATRLSTNWNVMEFPFFTFLLGDLHPHMLVLPYFVTSIGLILALFNNFQKFDLSFFKRNNFVIFFILSLFLGAAAGINTWFYSILLIILLLIFFIKNFKYAQIIFFKAVLNSLFVIIPIVILSFLLFLPLFITFNTSASIILPNEVIHRQNFIPLNAVASPPMQLIIFWAVFLIPSVGIISLWLKKYNSDIRTWLYSISIGFLPIIIWSIWLIILRGIDGFMLELQVRSSSLITESILLFFYILSLQSFFQILLSKKQASILTIFSSLFMTIAIFSILSVELFYINDSMRSRYNTVFKFYFISWILLSLSVGLGLFEVLGKLHINEIKTHGNKVFLIIVSCLVFIVAFIYPITATANRLISSISFTLNGLEYFKKSYPDDYKAIEWLNKNIKEKEIILEASGQDYSMDNMVSSFTGIPTLIGWIGTHEFQLRRNHEKIQKHLEIVNRIYTTVNSVLAKELLDKYRVRYVYIGKREVERYGEEGMKKFSKIGKRVFKSGNISIYKII